MLIELYEKLSEYFQLTKINIDYTLFKYSDEDSELYCKGTHKSLTYEKRKLKRLKSYLRIAGVKRTKELGFELPVGLTLKDIIALIQAEEKIPPEPAIANADERESQKIAINTSRVTREFNYVNERNPDKRINRKLFTRSPRSE